MNKSFLVVITFGLIVTLGIIFTGGKKDAAGGNVEVRNGIQYVTISARGGYSPQISTAKAGIPTRLIVKTNGTYDCSAALVIRDVGFQKILPQTGETEIDIGTKNIGETLQGVCGMGMYSFEVKFQS